MTSIIELDVSGTGVPHSYRVQITQSPAGEASATSEFDPDGFIEQLGDFQQTLLASSVTSRRLLSHGETSVREIGRLLFDALFAQPTLGGIYRASCAVAAERGEPLRMVLRVSEPELAALPWEAMFDRTLGSYVCRREPLVRYLPVASSPPPLTVQTPLRILALIASPRGLAPLDVEKEKDDLAKALARPIDRGHVVVHWIEHTTWSALQDALLSDTWHVVHFIGHGDFDMDRDEGVLALENEDGRLHRVPAEHIVELLREARPMPRLVVLNACESATSGYTDMFSGTAAALIRGGVSAVAAMQFEISDRAAIAFSRGFYAAIVQGRGVDEAVRSGRVAILGLGGDSLEWITPTLFLRGRETHLFSVAPLADREPPAAWPQPRVSTEYVPDTSGVEDVETRPAPPAAVGPRHSVEVRLAKSPETPAVHRADVIPGTGDHPDRLEEMWTVAKRVGWSQRPYKSNLVPLATVLDRDERIVGCRRITLTFASGYGVIVTDRHMYLSTDTPNNESWLELLSRIRTVHQRGPTWVRLPLPREVNVVNGCLVVDIDGEAPLSLTNYSAERCATLIAQYIAEANRLAQPS
ncbi:MAG TPA: CHAT domain-containing protein [Actinoplanes sp.]